MCEMRKFFVIFFLIILGTHRLHGGHGENVKIWKPNNNILNEENQVNSNDVNCDRVQFGKINSDDIIIDKLASKEFLLPISGKLILLDGGGLEIKSNAKKSNCLLLKETGRNYFLDPQNWESDFSKNVAVPDLEKIPCIYDRIKFPNGIYSGVDTNGVGISHTVSSIQFGNETFDRISFAAFKTTDLGSSVFIDSSPVQLEISERKCINPSGCKCNRDTLIHCPHKKEDLSNECLNPIKPNGFCHKICGAFITFKPQPNFVLNRLKVALRQYTNIQTHASKIKDDVIQVIFAEEKYTGDSISIAEEFHKKLETESREYGIARISKLYISGSQTNGNSSWGVVFASFFFVVALFGIIFYISYGDHSCYIHNRFGLPNFMTSSSSLPLSSTYRARFSPREDESGLIFDNNNSPGGSVMDLHHQSFDNPMYGQVSTGPDINVDVKEKVEDLYDLGEIKEEIGTEFEELPNIAPLIDVEHSEKIQQQDRTEDDE